jgi:hypothetical protein
LTALLLGIFLISDPEELLQRFLKYFRDIDVGLGGAPDLSKGFVLTT